MKTALVVVDVQKDYFPGGRREVSGALKASQNAKWLLDCFREKKLTIVHVQHISIRPGSTFFLPGTDGILFHNSVTPLNNEKVIEKHYPNGFRETDLQQNLVAQEVRNLIVCGMMSQMCIDATVRAAFDIGYTCTVAHDACAASSLNFQGVEISAANVHAAYMAALSAVYAKVISTEEVIRHVEVGSQ
jgi:nicotinamidase-related amidase